MPIGEIDTPYRERPPGSQSKLNTVRDGIRILLTIIRLVKEERPLQFFIISGAILLAVALILAAPLLAEFARTGLVPRFPTAILATGLVGLAFLSFTCGLVLDSVSRGRTEIKRLGYLAVPLFPAAEP